MPAANDLRRRRQQMIREILAGRPVARQSELVGLLRERGVQATQSSVSRDLRQLGIAKLGDGYVPPAGDADQGLDEVASFVRSVATAGPNLTVIGTATGAAQRVAVFLDRAGLDEVVGTVSGDDTIFVATRGATEQRRLLARLKSGLGQ